MASEFTCPPEAPLAGPRVGPEAARLADFESKSPRMREFLELVRRVGDSDATLLITGETGVGKERLARAIHTEGPRRAAPFVSVNCAALPDTLLETELFGHEAGAFTGADRRRKGRFETANKGTIFLDEIGEMPQHLQVKLLTVLQRRMVQRVGGDHPVAIDVRVMAATNRDLALEVSRGQLREDLYFRLNVVQLELPALRERAEDVPQLARSFLEELRLDVRRREVLEIGDDAMQALVRYAWPGNVRELHNVVERAVLLARGPRIGLEDLPEQVRSGPAEPEPVAAGAVLAVADLMGRPLREARDELVSRFERTYLDALLTRTRGRIDQSARLAGMTTRSLFDRLRRCGLRKEDYRV